MKCLVQSGVVCLVDVLEAVDLVGIVSSVWYVVEVLVVVWCLC